MKEGCNVGRQSLPDEIIENILSRLCVKDLLRLRVVCKQWEATISNPTFAEIHLQRYPRKLLAWSYRGELDVAELRNNCIEFVSAIECGLDKRVCGDLCSCDGIYLKYFRSPTPFVEGVGEGVKCVLWNPSCRTYREFYCPPSINARRTGRSIHAMYYDPLKKDYKIVMADMKHYAVYSCRDNKWGDVKEMKGFFGEYCNDKSVFVNGSVYWMFLKWLNPKYFKPDYRFIEVVCFDCKDESFKILPLRNIKNGNKRHLALTCLGDQLCIFISSWKTNELKKIMKRVINDEWVESKEECCLFKCRSEGSHSGHPLTPICQMSENELLFYVWRSGEVYMLYDKSKNKVVQIRHNHFYMYPVAHLENLLLL